MTWWGGAPQNKEGGWLVANRLVGHTPFSVYLSVCVSI
jgi:hypothetical protein